MIGYPFNYFYDSQIVPEFLYFENNPSWCTDKQGNLIDYYRFKCRDCFDNMFRINEGTFDSNVKDQPHRSIFITSPYNQFGNEVADQVFTMCIKFIDSISGKDAYICVDVKFTNVFDSFDIINERLRGYFTIVSTGLNTAFYFPQMFSYGGGKTLGEYIFRWDKEYYLEEKLDFVETISKKLTSNYYKNINNELFATDPMNIFDQMFIDGSNGENQYFYLNKKKFHYCIFPIILENKDKKQEHVLSIIYIFNKQLYYQHMLYYQKESYSQLIFQLFIFIVFGVILLYFVVLGFGLMAKFIVIHIKKVQYMLEGINVGGEYRLDFLKKLQKKQEDNLEKLKKINLELMQRNNSDKNKNKKNDAKLESSKNITN